MSRVITVRVKDETYNMLRMLADNSHSTMSKISGVFIEKAVAGSDMKKILLERADHFKKLAEKIETSAESHAI